ncbi:hypothetical protein, partial [uncultured Negativibacillus sp.]|uniref:hypothetical protein n=1 Tax=uncultured Negativibacillus sp. TaxID=1980696 RepID=UPI0025EABB2F
SLSARYRKPLKGMLLVRIWNAHRHHRRKSPPVYQEGFFFYHEYSRRKYSGFVKDNEANLNQNQQKFRSAGGFIPVYTIRLERERFLLHLFILQKDIFNDIFLHFLYIFAIFLQNLRIFDDILQPGFSSRPSPPYDINELQRRWFYENKLD